VHVQGGGEHGLVEVKVEWQLTSELQSFDVFILETLLRSVNNDREVF